MTDETQKPLQYNPDLAVKGQLEAFCEQGMRHSIWMVYNENFEQADGQRTHDGLRALERGDLLTVFNDEAKTDIQWQGIIDFDRTTKGGAGLQKDVEEGDWIKMFMTEPFAELVPAEHVAEIQKANEEMVRQQQEDHGNRHQNLRRYLKNHKK